MIAKELPLQLWVGVVQRLSNYVKYWLSNDFVQNGKFHSYAFTGTKITDYVSILPLA